MYLISFYQYIFLQEYNLNLLVQIYGYIKNSFIKLLKFSIKL